MSSSSALVVAAAVTALTLWHVPADRMQIAALAARWVPRLLRAGSAHVCQCSMPSSAGARLLA